MTSQVSLYEASLHESFTDLSHGFNFLTNHPYSQVYKDFLLQQILQTRELASEWFSVQDGKLILNQRIASEYLALTDQFLRPLMLFIHMASGAPARGSEITLILARNSMKNQRNLFLDPRSQLFLIRLKYSKTFNKSNIERDALRVIPQSLSFMILIYLVFIEPFTFYLNTQLGRPYRKDLLISFQKRPMASNELTRVMRSWTQKLIGQPIKVRTWRQLCQAFIRYGMRENIIEEGPMEDSLDDEAIAANLMYHSKQTATMQYGRQHVHIRNLAYDQQLLYLDFCRRYHEYIGLDPSYSLLSMLFPTIQLTSREEAGQSD